MANRIKGITVEIGGDTTKLSKALEGVNKDIKGTQSELKDVEKLLKLDPTNTELLAQKQRLLADAVSSTSDKLATLKRASEQAAQTKDNYDAWKAKYDTIKQKIGETETKLNELKEQSKEADEQLAKGEISQEKYDALQSEIKSTSDELKALKQSAKDVSDEFGNPVSPEQYDALQREIIETEQELQNLQREADNSNAALSKISAVGEKMKDVGDKISGVGEKMMPVTGAIAGLGTLAVKTGAEFDAEMSKVGAISGKVADEDLPAIIESAEAMGLSFEEGATATETAMNIMRAKAREMGSQTKYSASEAGQAFEYMAMAGWGAEDMINGIEGIMNLAAASGEELATTSDIVTDALTALGMSAEESGHFADVLAAASSSANTNVSLLGESFKYCAPVAGSMGASAEDLAIALGLMANSGIKGSQAGNSLKNALVNLVKPTDAQTAAMEQLGLITTETVNVIDQAEVDKAMAKVESKTIDVQKAQIAYNDAVAKYGAESSQAQTKLLNLEKAENSLSVAQDALTKAQEGTIETIGTGQSAFVDEYGNMKSLGEIMDVLRSNLGAIDVALTDSEGNAREYDDIIAELEQSEEGLTQAEQLKNAAILFGKQNLSGMLAIINASEDDYNSLTDAIYGCEGTAQNMAETMQDNLQGQLTILKSQLEELAISFSEILMPTIRAIVSKIQALADKLNSLSPEMKETVVKIALIVAAIGPALIVIGKVISTVGTILTIVPKVVNGIKLVKTAMAGLNTTFLANPIFLVIAAITALVAGFIYLWNNCEGFRNFWIGLWEEIQNTLYRFFEAWETGWNAIKEFFTNLWNSFQESFQIGMDTIRDTFTSIWTAISTTFTTIVTAIHDKAVAVFTAVKDFITTIFTAVHDFFATIFNAIYTTVSTVITTIHDTIVTVWTAVYETIKPLLDAFAYLFSTIFQAIQILIGMAMDWISEKISAIWNAIVAFITPILEGIKTTFETIWNGIVDTVTTVLDATHNVITTVWNAVSGFISEVLNAIWTFIHTAWNNYVNTITTVLNAIWSVVSSVWNTISGYISEVLNAIYSVISSVWNTVSTFVSGVLNTIFTTVSNIWNNIKTTISSVMTAIQTTVTNIWNSVKTAVSNTVTGIKDSIVNGFNVAVDFVKNLAGEAWNWGADIINNIVTGIKEKISSVAEAVTGVADTIREFLHFSVPDKGPLTDFESWMPDFMTGLANGIKNSQSIVQNAISSCANVIGSAVSGVINGLKPILSGAWNGISAAIKTAVSGIAVFLGSAWNNLPKTMISSFSTIGSSVFTILSNLKNSISGQINAVWNVIVKGLGSAVNYIKSLVGQSWRWGYDLMLNLVNGIRYMMDYLIANVRYVASCIRAYLHFSVPDKGPLTDFESWMPDFMNGLADGIRKNQKVVEKAVSGVAEAMQLTMSNDINYSLNGITSANNGISAGTVNNYYTNDNRQTFTQNNNSPKALDRLEIYRQTHNLIDLAKKV